MVFNESLIKRRKELGITQDELADKLGVSRQSISKWENGECMPDTDKLIRLSDVLGMSLDELTGREVRVEPIVLHAPEIPKTKKPLTARALIAAAACMVFGVLCFLAGRYLLPKQAPEDAPDTVSQTPDMLFASGFRIDSYRNNLVQCSFVANTSRNGKLWFYPESSSQRPNCAEATCSGGVYSAQTGLLPGQYSRIVFTVDAEDGEKSVLLAQELYFETDADGAGSVSFFAPRASEAPAVTEEPKIRVVCPEKEKLNEHDCGAVLSFLENADHSGRTNGVKLNPDYDPEDPGTWCYEYFGEVHPIAQWDEDGYLTDFTAFVSNMNLGGNIDLSGCERLEYAVIEDYNAGTVDLTGCPLTRGVYLTGTEWLYPDPIRTSMLQTCEAWLKHIDWIAVPYGPVNAEGWDFELILDAEGGGTIGTRMGDMTHYPELYITAKCDESFNAGFLGWYDGEGNLVSTDPDLELFHLNEDAAVNGKLNGAYHYTAKFR